MKCEIAKDLMTLYAEQLCSEQTKLELEEHLKNCPDCAKQMERYQKALETENVELRDKNVVENAKGLQPMKKVKKKLWYRKYIILLLVLLLLATFGGIGMLTYGEITNHVPGFTTIADAAKLKKVCEKLTQGDVEAFMEILPFTYEDQYAVKGSPALVEMDAYKDNVKKTIEEAYEYHFKGKEIEVKVGEMEQYSYDRVMFVDETPTYYTIDFYAQGEKIYSMAFAEIAMGKYTIVEECKAGEPQFVAQMLPHDELIMDICLTYATRSHYQKIQNGEEVKHLGGGLALMIKRAGTEEEALAFKEGIMSKATALYEAGWYLKDGMYAVEKYDEVAEKWIYKVWLMVENQENGAVCICEYRFHYNDSKLYIMPGEDAGVILSQDEAMPEDVKDLIENMFDN